MSYLTYQASLARVDDLLREAAEWRLGDEVTSPGGASPATWSMASRQERLRSWSRRLRRVSSAIATFGK